MSAVLEAHMVEPELDPFQWRQQPLGRRRVVWDWHESTTPVGPLLAEPAMLVRGRYCAGLVHYTLRAEPHGFTLRTELEP